MKGLTNSPGSDKCCRAAVNGRRRAEGSATRQRSCWTVLVEHTRMVRRGHECTYVYICIQGTGM